MMLPELAGEEHLPGLTPAPNTSNGVAQISEHGILEVEAMLPAPHVLCLLSAPWGSARGPWSLEVVHFSLVRIQLDPNMGTRSTPS